MVGFSNLPQEKVAKILSCDITKGQMEKQNAINLP
jgi:hypothetical protein